jgi:putative ABC transport system substrate-binding protein
MGIARCLFALVIAFATAFASQAQAPAQTPPMRYRLGHLWLGTADGDVPTAFLDRLREGLAAAGLNPAEVSIIVKDAGGDPARFAAAAANLVGLGPDLILTGGTGATLAVKSAGGPMPVVFVSAADPVGRGLVASLARPGGNVTGVARGQAVGKAIDAMRQLAPAARRLGWIYDPANMPAGYESAFFEQQERTARMLGFSLIRLPLLPGDDPMRHAASWGGAVDALALQNDTRLILQAKALVGAAHASGLPTVCFNRKGWTDAGCLLTYGENEGAMTRRAASIAASILRGARPADIPVEQASLFEVTINRGEAGRLGLEVPTSLLASADEVIE